MRTKTLLLAAALTAAGIASIQAQSNVYSLNVVGYYNIVVPGTGAGNLRMVGNSLDTTDKSLNALIPSAPNGTIFLNWNGAGFSPHEFIDPATKWDPTYTLALGEGGFIRNVTAIPMTITFVGEVKQGHLVNPLAANIDLVASQVPQAGKVTTDLKLPVRTNEVALLWKTIPAGGYTPYEVVDGPLSAPAWDPAEPTVGVGEGFFVTKAGAAQDWVRDFTVQ